MISSVKSFMKHKNKRGASTVPCGTPDVTSAGALCSPLILLLLVTVYLTI